MTSVNPQARRSRQAILDAARALIEEEGVSAVTHQRVASRAGVGRATVYRHWPEPHALLADVLTLRPLRFLEPAPGTFVERIRADLTRIADELNDPGVVALAATITERAQWDDETCRLRDGLAARLVDNTRTAGTEAVAFGELAAAPNPQEFLAQAIGPLWVQAVIFGAPITDTLVERVIADVVTPWLAKPANPGAPAKKTSPPRRRNPGR